MGQERPVSIALQLGRLQSGYRVIIIISYKNCMNFMPLV